MVGTGGAPPAAMVYFSLAIFCCGLNTSSSPTYSAMAAIIWPLFVRRLGQKDAYSSKNSASKSTFAGLCVLLRLQVTPACDIYAILSRHVVCASCDVYMWFERFVFCFVSSRIDVLNVCMCSVPVPGRMANRCAQARRSVWCVWWAVWRVCGLPFAFVCFAFVFMYPYSPTHHAPQELAHIPRLTKLICHGCPSHLVDPAASSASRVPGARG
jgi:hypothetical protein